MIVQSEIQKIQISILHSMFLIYTVRIKDYDGISIEIFRRDNTDLLDKVNLDFKSYYDYDITDFEIDCAIRIYLKVKYEKGIGHTVYSDYKHFMDHMISITKTSQ